MPIELLGNEEKRSNLKYCCKIEVGYDNYFGFVTSKYYEYDIQYNHKTVYSARFQNLSKKNVFFNTLHLRYLDTNNIEFFNICSSGIFGLGRRIAINEHTLKIPRTFSFSLPEVGFEIKMEKTKFRSRITNQNDIGVGLGLSYYVWLQQQRWLNTD